MVRERHPVRMWVLGAALPALLIATAIGAHVAARPLADLDSAPTIGSDDGRREPVPTERQLASELAPVALEPLALLAPEPETSAAPQNLLDRCRRGYRLPLDHPPRPL